MTRSNETRMCEVTRRDKIRKEHIRSMGTRHKNGASVQENYRKTTEVVRPSSHVRRLKREHMRRLLDVDIPGNRRGRTNLRWKDACKRDMTEVGLKEDNATNGRMEEESNQMMIDDETRQG